MHQPCIKFVESIKAIYPAAFRDIKVLDCGSYDVNGSNLQFFTDIEYTGVDLVAGPGVTCVSAIHELTFPAGTFDTVICTGTLEHDIHWQKSVGKMIELLRPGGLFIIMVATGDFPEHGTTRTTPEASPGTAHTNYYRNIELQELEDILKSRKNFKEHEYLITNGGIDLYFWGVKK